MIPANPHSAAGPRIEPPVSDPVPPSTMPEATAAPVPEDDPAVKYSGFHGLRAGGQGRSKDGPPMANSCVASLPSMTVPASAQSCTTRRILAGDVVLQQLGVRGGTDAGGVVDVLVADRDAVEFAPQRAGHHARFGGLGVGQRAFLGQQQEGVQRIVEHLDAGEAGLGELNRRKLLGGDLFGRLGDGRDSGHQRTSGTKIRAGSASRGIGVLTRASMASSRP